MTTTTDYLSTLTFGTSTGGAASSGETTSTLGENRTDYRIPSDTYHLSNLQLARYNQLLILISQYLKGGTRLQVLTQTSTPFGSGEYGLWIDTSGFVRGWSNTAASVFYVGGLKRTLREVAGNITVALTDDIVSVTSTAMARTVSLPTAASASGRQFTVLDGSGGAGTNNITVSAVSGNINGAGTNVISANYGKATYLSNGSNYFII